MIQRLPVLNSVPTLDRSTSRTSFGYKELWYLCGHQQPVYELHFCAIRQWGTFNSKHSELGVLGIAPASPCVRARRPACLLASGSYQSAKLHTQTPSWGKRNGANWHCFSPFGTRKYNLTRLQGARIAHRLGAHWPWLLAVFDQERCSSPGGLPPTTLLIHLSFGKCPISRPSSMYSDDVLFSFMSFCPSSSLYRDPPSSLFTLL